MAEGRQRVRDAAAREKRVAPAGARGKHPTTSEVMPDQCPVTPLGFNGTLRYYLDAEYRVVELAPDKHVRTHILGLFHGDDAWLRSVARWQRKNDQGTITGWKPEIVAADMLAGCRERGQWDIDARGRGRGAWKGDHDELIIHTGRRIWVFAKCGTPWDTALELNPGLIDGYVYSADPSAGVPAPRDTGTNPGDEIHTLLNTWTWKRGIIDPVLMLGWIGAAMIGGALDWRVMVWLTGDFGTGKSMLQKLVKLLLEDTLISLADTTGAGIWQKLKTQTLPVAIDEVEAQEDNRRMLDVVRLARIAASGGQLSRGSDQHTAVTFTLRSCFLFSSILIPPVTAADRSRMAVLDLLDLRPDTPEIHLDPAVMRDLGQRLRRRMIDQWGRFELTLARYKRDLKQLGHRDRGADVFGTLLTCADILLFGDFPEQESAASWLLHMAPLDLAETADEERDHTQCLRHLLGMPIDAYRSGERANLGEWINRAVGRMARDEISEARRVIAKFGVRIHVEEKTLSVAVANHHVAMHGFFDKTRWSTPRGMKGVWTQALGRLPGARQSEVPLYFGGANSRATLIPVALIPTPPPADDPSLL